MGKDISHGFDQVRSVTKQTKDVRNHDVHRKEEDLEGEGEYRTQPEEQKIRNLAIKEYR